MTLLEEIQEAAVDGESDLGTLLRKCKLLAARLDNKPLEDWLICESNGYPSDAAVPKYRIWPLELKGHFSGAFGSGMNNAPIPLMCIPEDMREFFEKYQCRQSVAAIEDIVTQAKAESTVKVSTGDLAVLLGTRVYHHHNCVQAWAYFGTGQLVELLNAVRNRILDFSVAIWKESPTAGDPKQAKGGGIQPAKITQIFKTTVYGGSANLVGSAENSSVVFNIEVGDIKGLTDSLRATGIPDGDFAELKKALKTDPKPIQANKFGPMVSAWIGKAIQAIAAGGAGIGIGAAANLIGQAISKYYGLG